MSLPSLPVLKAILRELTTSERTPRVPEPDLVMDDPAKVEAYVLAAGEDGSWWRFEVRPGVGFLRTSFRSSWRDGASCRPRASETSPI